MRSRIALLIPLILFGCALAPVKRPWKLELTTSGGFTGRGSGAVSIDSDGAIHVTTAAGARCKIEATSDELKAYESLLAAAKPEKWRASYAPQNRCCDRIQYELTLTIADKTYETEWISAPLPMPKDLTAIAEALQQTLHDHACAPSS